MLRDKTRLFKQGLRWAVRRAFFQTGFRWEVRRSGDIEIGLWRLSWKSKRPNAESPVGQHKRFVLLPGFGDSPLSWLSVVTLLLPVFRQKFDEIVLMDFPGFDGFLSTQRCVPTMDLMIAVVGDTLDSLKPHTLFGHSLGGWLSAHYATECGIGRRPLAQPVATRPSLYRGPEQLILVSPSGVFSSEEDRAEFQKKFDRALRGDPESFRTYLFSREPIWFRFFVPRLAGFFRRKDVIQFAESFKEDHLLERRLNSVQAKVWLIWGEDDRLVLPGWARSWTGILTECSHVILLPKVGHIPQLESPVLMAAVLRQLLLDRNPAQVLGVSKRARLKTLMS